MRESLRRRRAGFTLMEVVVAAVLLAMLAAVSMPYIVEFLDRQRAQTTADKLAAVATGIAAFAAAVHTAGGTATTYPGKISELANVIVAGSTVTHNSCGSGGGASNFNAAAVASWNTSGPFVSFMISTTGLVTPLGTIADSMVRTPATTATVGTLAMRMFGVDAGDAADLDQIVDGGDGSTVGTVRWTTGTAAGTVDISYLVPIAARC